MNTRRRQPGRALWQRLLRVLLCGVLVVVMAYALLPWWVPQAWVRGWVEAKLSRELGLTVRAGEIDCSWARVKVHDLELRNPADGERLAMIEELRCECAPLTVLCGGELPWVEVRRAHAKLVFGAQGSRPALLEALNRYRPTESSLQVRRIAIRSAELEVADVRSSQRWLFELGEVQLYQARPGLPDTISYTARLIQPGDNAMLSGRFSRSAAHSELQLAVMKLDFAQLPSSYEPFRRVSGRGDLRAVAQLDTDLQIQNFSLDLAARDLRVRLYESERDDSEWYSSALALHLEGRLPAGEDLLSLNRMECAFDGGRLSATARLNGGVLVGEEPVVGALHVDGTFHAETFATLCGEGMFSHFFAETDAAQQLADTVQRHLRGLSFSKPAKIALDYCPSPQGLAMNLELDATTARVSRSTEQLKPAGREFLWSMAGHWRDGEFFPRRSQVTLGRNRIAFHRAESAGARAERNMTYRGTMALDDLPGLRDFYAPGLRGKLVGSLSGTWRYIARGESADSLAVEVLSSSNESLECGAWFSKPAGKALSLSLTGSVHWRGPGGQYIINTADVLLQYGDAEVRATVLGGLDSDWTGRYQIRRVEQFLSACPPYMASTLEMRGGISGEFRRASSDDWRQQVQFDETQLRIPGVWYKRPGDPMSLDMTADAAVRAVGVVLPHCRFAYEGQLAAGKISLPLELTIRGASAEAFKERFVPFDQCFPATEPGKFSYIAQVQPRAKRPVYKPIFKSNLVSLWTQPAKPAQPMRRVTVQLGETFYDAKVTVQR